MSRWRNEDFRDIVIVEVAWAYYHRHVWVDSFQSDSSDDDEDFIQNNDVISDSDWLSSLPECDRRRVQNGDDRRDDLAEVNGVSFKMTNNVRQFIRSVWSPAQGWEK